MHVRHQLVGDDSQRLSITRKLFIHKSLRLTTTSDTRLLPPDMRAKINHFDKKCQADSLNLSYEHVKAP